MDDSMFHTLHGRSRRLSATLAACTMLAIIGFAASASAESIPEPTKTIFEFREPVPLAQTIAALPSNARIIELRSAGPNEGGFRPASDLSLASVADEFSRRLARATQLLEGAAASDDFQPSAAPEDPNPAPPLISGITLTGIMSPDSLGPLSNNVASREVQSSFALPGFTSDTPPMQDLEESSANGISEDGATATAAAAAAVETWAPLMGRSITSPQPGNQASIIQTQTWSTRASINNFGTGNAYEHDFKLINSSNNGTLVHPFCGGQGDDFWADRNRSVVFVTNVPSATKPYFDTDASDSCRTEDFTIGLYHPIRLNPGVRYVSVIGADRGQESSSPYALVAQRLGRGCDTNPFCVGGPFGNHGSQLLIGASKGRAPECRRWHRGRESARCG